MRSLGFGIVDVTEYEEFFGHLAPQRFQRQAVIDELLSHDLMGSTCDDNTSDTVVFFIKGVTHVVDKRCGMESSVDALGKLLFNLVGFGRIMNLNMYGPDKIKYLISGCDVEANPDIAVQANNNNEYLVAVQEDKSYKVAEDDFCGEAEPQLVAAMIGTFYVNVMKSRATLRSQTMYGIVMLGTHCTLYKLHMTVDILSRVTDGLRSKDVGRDNVERFSRS
jgi:hypothetical protein